MTLSRENLEHSIFVYGNNRPTALLLVPVPELAIAVP